MQVSFWLSISYLKTSILLQNSFGQIATQNTDKKRQSKIKLQSQTRV